MGEHLHLDGGRDCILLDGVNCRVRPLEDVHERRFLGDPGGRRALLLHARVLGEDRHLAHPVPLHRLEHHRPVANDRILLDLVRGAEKHQRGHVLATASRHGGEAGFVNAWAGFIVGMAGWGFILFEIFMGEAGKVAASGDNVNEHVKKSYSTMRFIVSVGWSIYPLGYFFGYLMGGVEDSILNLVYNLADFV